MITDVLREIQSIIDNIGVYAPVELGLLSAKDKSIAVRLVPSGQSERFLDTSRTESVHIQVLVKSPNQIEAISTLERIGDALEENDIETYVYPNFVSKDTNSHIYTALYKTHIRKGE